MALNINVHAKVHARTCASSTPQKDHSGLVAMSAKDAFVAVYAEIKSELMRAMAAQFDVDAERAKYLTQMMDATCLGGKYNRGITVVEVATELMKGNVCGETLFQAAVLGWCIEFMQAHFLVEDDIMDESKTRRGNPCWYLMPGVSQAVAINDGLILFGWCTKMLEIFIPSTHPNKGTMISMLHDVHMKTCIGQFYDTTSMYDADALDATKPLHSTTTYREYTCSVYNRIVKFKTAYYTYHLPMIFGLAVTNRLNSVRAAVVENLAVVMGEYFQVQDDFLDCFGDPVAIGKIGTDIEDKKCCWLAAKFLDTTNGVAESAADVATWKANYGQHDAKKVEQIKAIYKKHNLTSTFEAYETDVVEKVDAILKDLATESPEFSNAIRPLWERTYKRKK